MTVHLESLFTVAENSPVMKAEHSQYYLLSCTNPSATSSSSKLTLSWRTGGAGWPDSTFKPDSHCAMRPSLENLQRGLCHESDTSFSWLTQTGREVTLSLFFRHWPGIGWAANTMVGRGLEAGVGLVRDGVTWFARKWVFSWLWKIPDSSGYIHVESRAKELLKKICSKQRQANI